MDRPWFAYYDPGVELSLQYPEISLPEMFDRTAAQYADRVATVFHGARLRYGQLKEQIDALAASLRQMGVRPGDRVALMLPNLPQFVVAFYGVLKAGAIVVPTNPLYTESELAHQLADAGARALITLDPFFDRVQQALPKTNISFVIVMSIQGALPRHLQPLARFKQWRQGIRTIPAGGIVYRWEDMVCRRPDEKLPERDPHGIAVLQYTGGTTGVAKGAILTHHNLLVNAIQARDWQGAIRDDIPVILCAAPFFHVYGLTVCLNLAVASGATMLLVPRFIPREVARVAARYKPQLFPGVPTMYIALSQLPNFSKRQFGSLRICLSGAAPLPPDVQRSFQRLSDIALVEGYGLTEASPVTHCNPVAGKWRVGSIGIPFPDTDAMITDPDTWEPLPPGTIGELTISGPQVMRGYWNQPEETAAVLRDGWLHTGDLAVMDTDGFFRIVDRKKDLIIASGYNVYPREVEDVLYSHPAIKEAAVIGVGSQYRGETVKAVIVLKDGAQAPIEEITAFCRQRLAAYKVPTVIDFRTDLPKSLVGKILRRELREPDLAPSKPSR